ncbi:rCG51234 [Rattus norvegicus]|uniref:RCG51234 n=1 Tax=Rattus norvegicus TaxID=10116 RepID=A6IZF1_RAT|nr:rCG51234 [Rattus norvegicus]
MAALLREDRDVGSLAREHTAAAELCLLQSAQKVDSASGIKRP